ncbi:unnamed protein product, partial [Sphagnum troendelagicum]
MGNALIAKTKSKRANSIASSCARVVMIDGSFTEFKEPITVAELMMDYPQHLVCHSSAVMDMQQQQQSSKSRSPRLHKKAALPADVHLELGRLYYLLPASQFQGPLVAGLAHASSGAVAAHQKLNRSSTGVDAKKKPSKEDASSTATLARTSTAQQAASGSALSSNSSSSWKPRLETIQEVGALSRRRFYNF